MANLNQRPSREAPSTSAWAALLRAKLNNNGCKHH
jgi:hypothetical protein